MVIRVARIKRCTGRGARLRPGEERDGNAIGLILGSRQDAVDKGSHGSDGGVLPRRIIDMVPPEGKVGRK